MQPVTQSLKTFEQVGARMVGFQMKVLLVGETWISYATHVKGFDAFSSTTFHNGATGFLEAMLKCGIEIEQLPAHDAPQHMPRTPHELEEYSVIILSDIGANSLLLSNATWLDGQPRPNALTSLMEWTQAGGGLMMVGGYLTFQGINALGNYADSPVESVLPVKFYNHDDRCETPQGQPGVVIHSTHPITTGLTSPTPVLLGHNRSSLKPDAQLLMTIGDDPLLACRSVGQGRSLIWSSDIGPHWCPEPFIASQAYAHILSRSILWLAGQI